MRRILLLIAALFLAGPAVAQKNETAFGSIIHHADGRRTERQKMGGSDQWREVTYNKDNVCETARIYWLDKQGRLMRGEIYDGRGNLKATTWYIYDKETGQRREERMYAVGYPNHPIRRLFYPGVFKDPQYANRITAFNYDPSNPDAAPRVDNSNSVKTYEPVTKENRSGFEPGLPTGSAAPSAQPARSRPAKKAGGKDDGDGKPAPRTFLLPQRKSSP